MSSMHYGSQSGLQQQDLSRSRLCAQAVRRQDLAFPLAFSPESASKAGAPGAADNCGPAISEPNILVRA